MNRIFHILTVLCFMLITSYAAAEAEIRVDDGTTLVVTADLFEFDPLTLATTVKEHPELRSVQITWTLPKEAPRFDELQEVTAGWGSHIESLSVHLHDGGGNRWYGSESTSQCINWLATLCPRITTLTYQSKYFFPLLYNWSVLPDYSCSFPELKTLHLVGIVRGTTTYGLDQLLSGMPQLTFLDLDLGPWSPGTDFVSLLKAYVPHIKKIVIRRQDILQDPDRVVNVSWLGASYTGQQGITPGWEYFDGWNELADLRVLHLSVFRDVRGASLSFLQLPHLYYLRSVGLESISIQDLSNLLAGSPQCRELRIGGSRREFKQASGLAGGGVRNEVIYEPQYCELMMSPRVPPVLSDSLQKLSLEFVRGLHTRTLLPLLRALPNLTLLELQNCPEATPELVAELQAHLPDLTIQHNPNLPVGTVRSWNWHMDTDDD